MISKVYLKSPIWTQNVMVSLYGLRNDLRQRGGAYRKFLKGIAPQLGFSREEIVSLQSLKLKETVARAALNVRYYRELFAEHSIDTGKIDSLDDVRRIPILSKETLRANPDSFLDSRYRKSGLRSIYTSGTSGAPLRVYHSSETRQLHFAFYDRFLRQHLGQIGKVATLGGRVVVDAQQSCPPFWRHSYFQKNLLLSSHHLKDEFLPAYIERLRSYQPKILEAYPSSIFVLAKYMQENNISGEGVTAAIVTSAGCLLPLQRRVIESVFNVPVIDQYGSAEMCVFVGQCRKGRYHIHMDYGLLEFLSPDGSPAKAGEEADLVCTGFVNDAMPLIRYKIGDRGVFSDERCPCGCQFQVMEKVVGRANDVVYSTDGRGVSHLGSAVYAFPVREVQFVQNVVGELEVLIVKGLAYTEETERRIEDELKMRLGKECLCHFTYLKQIPRGAGGKLKTIVSNVTLHSGSR